MGIVSKGFGLEARAVMWSESSPVPDYPIESDYNWSGSTVIRFLKLLSGYGRLEKWLDIDYQPIFQQFFKYDQNWMFACILSRFSTQLSTTKFSQLKSGQELGIKSKGSNTVYQMQKILN